MSTSFATSDRAASSKEIMNSFTSSQELGVVSSSETMIGLRNPGEAPVENEPFRELLHKKQQKYSVVKVDDKKKQSSKIMHSSPVESPIDRDVLFARGGLTNHHPGNKRLRELVKQFKLRYDKSNKRVKTEISQYIVDKIRGEGGRFLKRDDKSNLWNVVQNNEARRKASQSLRDCHQYGKKKYSEVDKNSVTSSSSQAARKSRPQTVSFNSSTSDESARTSVPNKMLYLLRVVSHERTQEQQNKML